VLSGGGARGAAHIGVLKVLDREKIPVDCIVGTSFGALVGGLYAIGYSAEEIDRIFAGQDWNSIFTDAPERRNSPLIERKNFRYLAHLAFDGLSPELPTGLWGGQKMTEILNGLTTERMIAAQYDFDKLPVPFRAVATDLLTGRPYVFSGGSLTQALRASVAIPMLFTPVEKEDMLLVDGGLANNLPTDVARSMGAELVIAVDVTSPLLKKEQIRTFFDVMDQALSLLMFQNVDGHRGLADITIRPDLDGFSYSDYTRIEQISKRGLEGAEKKAAELKALFAGYTVDRREPPTALSTRPVIDSVAFQGLESVPASQLRGEVRSRPGRVVDPNVLQGDLSRLYATRLFESVDVSLEPVGRNQYRLNYILSESPSNTLGASIRYDKDYKFTALAELTARQVFNTPSSLTISSQFGGIENHSAALRYVPPAVPFFYVEPKVHLRRRERLDIRNGQQVDKYTDRRIGGQLMLGWTFLRRLEVEIGYRDDRTTVSGGTLPNRLEHALHLAGLTMRLNRDTLDSQEYARTGMALRLNIDKRIVGLGSSVSYSKWQGDVERFFPLSHRSTLHLRAGAGYSRGDIPFYDRFFVGGFNFSEGGSRHLLGYERDEFSARQMGFAGAGVRHQVFSHPLSFAKRGFVSAHYNIAGVSDRRAAPYHFDRYHGVGLGFALDTLIGPIRLNTGWGENGRFKFYLSLGPGF
jgi:NTE family protein